MTDAKKDPITESVAKFDEVFRQAERERNQPMTIVLDMTGGVMNVAYTTQPINIVVISHDRDDIASTRDDEGGHLSKTMEGRDVYVTGGSVEIDPEVVEHYRNELNNQP
jgi:hypothetical protein